MRDDRGQGMAEYIVIVIVIAVIVILGIRYFGGSLFGKFENATEEISSVRDGSSKTESAKGTERTGSAEGGRTETTSFASSAGSGGSHGGSSVDRLRAAGIGEQDVVETPRIHIDGRTLLLLAIIVAAIGFAVVFSTGKRKGKGKKGKRKGRLRPAEGEEGQAMAEFVLVAITFLFVILGIMQMALCLNAYTLVRYAAYNAARAGIVHSGDREKMLEAARISLLAVYPRHGRADHLRGFTENYLAARSTDQLTDPGEGAITDVLIVDNLGRNPGDTVTFDDPASPTPALITVQVVHRYELVIPLVNRILYHVYRQFVTGVGYRNETLDYLSHETDRLRRPGGAYNDIEYRIPLVAHYTMRLQSDYVEQ